MLDEILKCYIENDKKLTYQEVSNITNNTIQEIKDVIECKYACT